jgi:hypothetical protein
MRGLELALDPDGQAHGPDALDVARPGTVGETVEDLPIGIRGGLGGVRRLPTASSTGVSATTDRALRSCATPHPSSRSSIATIAKQVRQRLIPPEPMRRAVAANRLHRYRGRGGGGSVNEVFEVGAHVVTM